MLLSRLPCGNACTQMSACIAHMWFAAAFQGGGQERLRTACAQLPFGGCVARLKLSLLKCDLSAGALQRLQEEIAVGCRLKLQLQRRGGGAGAGGDHAIPPGGGGRLAGQVAGSYMRFPAEFIPPM